MISMSVAQTAMASMRTSTSARPGSGTGFSTSWSSSGPPSTQAFMVLGIVERVGLRCHVRSLPGCRSIAPILASHRCRCQCSLGTLRCRIKLLEATMRRRALAPDRKHSRNRLAGDAATAQAFPTKPVTIIVPFSAGGPLDTLCRILAEPMQASLGQSVVVEAITGAGGSIGIMRVARSAADGYTIISGNQGSHITLGAVQQVSFDLLRDFAPVAMFATTSQLILVRKSLEVANSSLSSWP